LVFKGENRGQSDRFARSRKTASCALLKELFCVASREALPRPMEED
jgi:hypothetical protein